MDQAILLGMVVVVVEQAPPDKEPQAMQLLVKAVTDVHIQLVVLQLPTQAAAAVAVTKLKAELAELVVVAGEIQVPTVTVIQDQAVVLKVLQALLTVVVAQVAQPVPVLIHAYQAEAELSL